MSSPSSSVEPEWVAWLYWLHLFTAIIGATFNLFTFITIKKHGAKFGQAIRRLLQHQSMVDCAVCSIAICLVLQKELWMTGVRWIDVLVCHVWHSERPYWAAVFISILNLVAIAVDRHLIVCRPLTHGAFGGRTLTAAFCCMYALMAVVCAPPLFLLYVTADGKCTSEGETVFGSETARNVYSWLGVATLCFYYVLPLIAFIYLYSTLIYTLNRSKSSMTGGPIARQHMSAQRRTTLAAITLTVCFILTIALDLWGYALDLQGVVEYHVGVPIQKLGVYLCMLNSSVNPFVYAILMPEFRRAMVLTIGDFTCGRCGVSRVAGVDKVVDSEISCTRNGYGNGIGDSTIVDTVFDKV